VLGEGLNPNAGFKRRETCGWRVTNLDSRSELMGSPTASSTQTLAETSGIDAARVDRRRFSTPSPDDETQELTVILSANPPAILPPLRVVAGVAGQEKGTCQWQAMAGEWQMAAREPLPAMKDCAEHNASCARIGVRSMRECSPGEAHDFEGVLRSYRISTPAQVVRTRRLARIWDF
jgi:hypothetical protein